MSVIKVTKNNYDDVVLGAENTVLLDFSAEWCGPCKMVGPIVEEIAAEHPELTVGKIDVDSDPELATKFGIVSIPALFVLKNGEIVNQAVGYRPKDELLKLL